MDTITIAGRHFKGASGTTAECDIWNQGLIAKSGLDKLHMMEGESADSFALRVLRTISAGTDIFLLLGGMLLPAESEACDWSPAMAEETAHFLRKCTKPEDKQAINAQITAAIIGFLQAELISIRLIPRSLRPPDQSELVRPN